MTPNVIVSLTSFPARIEKIWLTIETMMRQSVKPRLILLWLSKEQFSSKSALPKSLLSLEKRGLRIELRKGDIKSHKKYFYSFIEYPDDYVVTIDDDVYYNTRLIEFLWRAHLLFPDCICCNESHFISFAQDHQLLPYSKWRHNFQMDLVPSKLLCPIGIGGILYPPHSLAEMVTEENIFMQCCPRADDIWLKVMSLMNNRKVVQTTYHSRFMPVKIRHNQTLSSSNIGSGNDCQIQSLRKFMTEHINFDPFAFENYTSDDVVQIPSQMRK